MRRAQEISHHDDGSILVSQLIDAPLDGNDFFDVFLNTLHTAFGDNYFDEESEHHKRAKIVFTALQQKRVTKREFGELLMNFVTRCRYPNWSVAEFFPKNWERERLYPHAWYVEQVQKDKTATTRIEAFKVNGVVWYRYRGGCALPYERVDLQARFSDVYTIPERKAVDGEKGRVTTDSALRELNKRLIDAHKEIGELQKTIKLLRIENEQLRRDIECSVESGELWDIFEEENEGEPSNSA